MRTALVTGAGSGIGAACARLLDKRDHAVVCVDLDPDAAARVASGLRNAVAVPCDVRSSSDCAAAVSAALDAFGGIDVIVNCAGIEIHGTVDALTVEDFALVVDVNLTGSYRIAHAAAPQLTNGAAIVLIGSINSQVSLAGQSAYAASKGGVLMLGRALAVDLAPRGIRVNVVGPGVTDTPMSARSLADPVRGPAYRSRIPLGRAAHADEIAEVVAFVASPAASYLTGAFIPVDGGWLAHA